MTRGIVVLLLAAGAIGCALGGASAGAKTGAAPATTATGTTATRTTSTANERRAILADNIGVLYGDAPIDQARDFTVAPAIVQKVIRETFTGFMIPITVDDPATARIGNADFFRTRQFMGMRMTQLVDCGTSMTGPNAASFRIFLSLVARTKDNGKGGTTVSMQLIASGRDLTSGSSTDKIPCGSTGKIEQRFLDEVAKRVGR